MSPALQADSSLMIHQGTPHSWTFVSNYLQTREADGLGFLQLLLCPGIGQNTSWELLRPAVQSGPFYR